ncbi:MAG: UDP-N-acetylmuramoyl-L-alanine--D-glutamate ligase [Micavibrio aeruginosavorus]|uniref:UDP-N-acetylmuramoylalanine--D-glutamate ligase n=1 Tax=Micavibrio aeruginosavorus TaxID=349221 RepID=A0A7T5R249_9BACT|nr:MAG: UDP-N-acetylmuramoyl-L-alanine--D-glutamate ligase [Micavibrio aeruginosavorus]
MINLRSFAKTLDHKPVAVFGIGRSNMAVIRSLHQAGVAVVAGDDDPTNIAEAVAAGAKDGLLESDFTAYAFLVLAPGVPLHFPKPHPVVEKARRAGLEIICDVEFLYRLGHGRQTIAITGTNGKSTTTALVGHILSRCNVAVEVGGNIGHAVLDLDMPPHDGAFVIEMSSYQIDLCPTFTPDIAVHLNLTPDHLDRHGSLEGYYQAKKNLFRGQGAAIIGIDDGYSLRMSGDIKEAGERDVYPIAVGRVAEGGVYTLQGALYDAMFADTVKAGDLDIATLPGLHNQQNAAAAYAAARMTGIPPDKIMRAMRSFPGLPHRQFIVAESRGVKYVNDSKATNAAAAEKALACYEDIFWIVGGRAKEGGLSGLEPYMHRLKGAFAIGEAMNDFATWLEAQKVNVSRCGTLEEAVRQADQAARANGKGVVLLSPACASFDQFRSFEHRGEEFTRLVKALQEVKDG